MREVVETVGDQVLHVGPRGTAILLQVLDGATLCVCVCVRVCVCVHVCVHVCVCMCVCMHVVVVSFLETFLQECLKPEPYMYVILQCALIYLTSAIALSIS